MRKHYLESLFAPSSVVVICDKEYREIGEQVIHNLRQAGYAGEIHAVAEGAGDLAGMPARASLAEVGQSVELAIIAARAERQPDLLRQSGECKVSAAVVLSGGFSETQEKGLSLQNELVEIARDCDIALVGPRCLGIVRPIHNFNASSARSPVAGGQVALVTQSGAFCSAILDWSDANGFGFSAVASLGATSDVKLGDVLDYLAQDPHTRSILLDRKSVV